MKFTFPPESKPLAGYTIKRAIHRGGFGEVYYALSDGGKEVALKLLQHNLEVELRGVKQCLNLKHPNLVTIFDVREDDEGDQWIVMEYVSGKSLATVIDDAGGPLSPDETQRWLGGMVAGLAHLHDSGLVHRDLKPANVFQEAGVVKIGDVGLSKFITQSRRSAQTESVGTVYYMAPEVARGRYGREVDVYSLGIVLYELLTGRVPFDGESTAEILMKHLTEKPDLSPLAPKLRPVLARALEKDEQKRTSSVLELEREFNAALAGVEVAIEIPDESFVGRNGSPNGIQEVVDKYKSKAKHLHAEAHKAATAAKKAAKLQHKAERKRQKAERHANRVAQLASAGASARRPNGTAPARHVNRGEASGQAHWVKIAAVVFVLFALFAPSAAVHSLKLLFVGGIFLTLGYGAIRLCRLIAVPPPRIDTGNPPTGSPRESTGFCNFAIPRHARRLTPETLRSIPLRYRLADLTGAMTYAALVTALVTGGIALVMPSLFSHGDAGSIGLFAITTLLGAWGVLVPSKLWEGTRVPSHVRRLVLLGTGLLVGGAGFWLHENLMVNPGYGYTGNGPTYHALFDNVGARQLSSGNQPALAGYMVFFGVLFGIRHWWRHCDAFRKKRFRVGSLLLTGLAGGVLPLVFAFPPMWGLMWAVAISSVVQLSAAWVTPADRARLMEGSIDA